MKRSRSAYDIVKRVDDVVVAAVGLVVLAPVLLVIATLVRLKLGAPVIFTQTRPGLDGRPFSIRKFRTMRSAEDGTGAVDAVSTDGDRLTPFGARLRALSLDELPELYNVLRGDMSIVGPRPLLPEYLDRYTAEQARRHEVRPGITGWAQVNGRNDAPWSERLAMDVWYVDHRSFALDMRILARTLGVVRSGAGVSAQGSATVQPFDPSSQRSDEEAG